MELANRIAVVTGAGAGIGRALAARLAAEGMKLVLADRDEAALDKAAAELGEAGAEVVGVQTDVASFADVERLAERSYKAFGAVHLVCNNAGVLGRITASWEQPLENWRWVFDVNFFGVVHGVRAFVPRMLAGGEEGYVLNTASIAGLVTGPFFAPYNASKHAVVALSECLHHELRALQSKIGVGVLCPGWVNTALAAGDEKLPDDLRPANLEAGRHPLAAQREQSVRQMVAAAEPPEGVIAAAVAAVRRGAFYIFPHEQRKGDAQSRFDDILAERSPRFGAAASNPAGRAPRD